ncbi:BrnA antitoxin family protein [Pollutimonas bauzanensis]|uniref:BrnA antitoxin of type II toxin-antitoxin system n=1 Tax=Pollutimonas bauzanensis TaxID=658167 RepID=A0A1M5Z2Z8_9BURK|nr:BrnA antitoxin family protein [Pollutimonas bauzanensis]SHI18559.1 BrnA antitoxin of type II toxin-antitoxin system [Pollutimonas bauzanensis]
MLANRRNTRSTWADPDDAPGLTEEFFEKADLYQGDKLVKRGRPKLDNPKVAVSLRLPSEVLARWKATGAGWQTRMAESLKHHAPKT